MNQHNENNQQAAPEAPHPDDLAVDRFAVEMKAKMAKSRAKGRGGWDDPVQCTVEKLAAMLCEHVEKGDPVDIANFAMMVQSRGGCAIDVYEALAVFMNARQFGKSTVAAPEAPATEQVLPPWPEPISLAAHERASIAPWLTDTQIVDALHSLGIDTEMSKYGFPEIQVRGTNVPNIRRLVAKLAAPEAPASEQQDEVEQRAEKIRLAHANPVGRSRTHLIRDAAHLLAHIALLKRPAATTASASIDTPEFRELVEFWSGKYHSALAPIRQGHKEAWEKLIAHIDSRAPAPSREEKE